MFKIESYVTPILLSYVDKYVKDFRPADAQLSLWGGGVVLHNLVIKTDVLQQEVALPFTLVSGRIHELFIQVPWTKIMSEPIVVNIDTIECILSIRPPSTDETPAAEPPSRNTQVVEAPPGYMQALVRRIVSNIAVRIHHLIIKYVQDDIILSLNVKHLSVDSAAPNWQPAFADIDQHKPAIRRLVVLDDLTLCLDSSDSDGKIRFYQDPLLYRCRLEFRVLIKLVSANTRRASNVSIQLRSSKLAWGVTSEQMVLVLRLLKERIPDSENAPAQTKLAKAPLSTASIHNISSNQAEPARPESWSEWAWSWMPSMAGRDHGIEEAPPPAQPLPISAAAYLDDVSLSIKLMELEGGLRRRARSILEFHAKYAAFKSKMCLPTSLRFKMGIRTLHIKSFGKCTCGHMDYYASYDEATMYLSNRTQSTEDFKWPEDNLEEKEKKIIVKDKPEETTERILNSVLSSPDPEAGPAAQRRISVSKDKRVSQFKSLLDFEVLPIPDGAKSDANDLWTKLEPLIFMEYSHERTPPNMYTNPYENPPSDFEYSDWEEQCNLNIQIKPIEIRLCMGLIHRLKAIQNFFGSNSEPESDIYLRVLTVEECDALLENLPQQRVNLDIKDFRIRVHPWDHSPSARPRKPQVVLDVSVPKGNIIVTLPLYPNRVCSAASQMPDDTGPLGRGSRVHVTAALNSIQASICSLKEEQPKPCVRADLRFVVHVLLHPEYFNKKKSVLYSYALKIREANVSGSSARLHAASQVLLSVINQTMSLPLYYTTLAKDALNDEELVALDITLEELSVRGYITKKVTTHILQLQAIRATVIQSPGNSDVKQAWLFSGPDVPTNTAYIRIAAQWCSEPFTGSMDFLGIWSEPGALAIDPLFVSWLSYKPLLKSAADASPPVSRTISATMYLNRRRNTPPPSRAKSASSQAEQVHQKARSADSSSEFSELKDKKPLSQPVASTESWWKGEKLLQLHERLKKVFITMELGLLVVYITTKTASAVDCATVRLAMENHATNNQGVLVFSAGRWSMCTSTMTINLWHFIDHEGPTYIDAKEDQEEMEKQESFPWKMMLADMSCYALESKQRGKLGQLKMSKAVYPRTVLELISTSIILSVAKKTIQSKLVMKKSEQPSHHHEEISKDEKKMKYFTAGVDFKPANLKDFCRGPEGRFRDTLTQNVSAKPEVTENKPALKTVAGPTVSLGFNLHADTPPIIVKIEHDQVYLVFSTLHCLSHVLSLLGQDPMAVPKQQTIPVEVPSPPKHVTRSSLSEMDEISLTESSRSETRSDLMTIFEAQPTTAQRDGHDHHMRTFLWFQWVVSTATLVISTDQVKLAFDIDDMITTIDLQEHYNQLKIKIASASIKQYERSENGQWTAGVLGGRVLEALEPPNPNEASHFLTVTVTQARISNLPGSWREELHPKCLEQKNGSDSMWEVFATLAPLEIVILPAIMDNVMSVINAMAPRSYCQPLIDNSPRSAVDLPFVYINGGGIRFLLNCDIRKKEADDTFLLTIGKIAMNPHPDNPICRRPIAGGESAWNTLAGNLEGRQYEIFIKGVSLRTARLAQLVSEEESVAESQKSLSSENPAVKWGSSVTPPVLTPVLHPLDINFVLAPSLIVGGVLTCGPAYEFNLTSDCAIEINIDQLNLAFCMQKSLQRSFKKRIVVETDEINTEVCPYADILVSRAPLAQDSPPIGSTLYSDEVTTKSEPDTNIAATLDSGVETATSRSTLKSGPNVDAPLKKTLSVTFVEQRFDAADHIEVFVTMGVIELSLYTIDDGSSAMVALKPPHTEARRRSTAAEEQLRKANRSSRSLTEVTRTADVGVTQMDLSDTKMVRKNVGNIPLCHITLHQPNLYYWKRRSQTSLQVSLFNIWVGFGLGLLESYWHCPLISTTKGVPDPVTEIPPALATMKYTSSSVGNAMSAATSSKVNLQLDIERPILIELSEDSLRRLVGIYHLLKMRVSQGKKSKEAEGSPLPLLFRIRNFMAQYVIDAATMNISQLGITGFDISAGWDSVSMQVSWNARRERLIVRGLINSLLISSGSYLHAREPVLQPLQIGIQMEAIWEAWRRAEGGYTAKEPTVRFNIDADRVTFDIRPENLAGIIAILNTLNTVVAIPEDQESVSSSSSESISEVVNEEQLSSTADGSHMTCTAGNFEMGHHYYKDDLRSGAFKIVSGGQLPMAYQVTLHRNIVSWKYPHPRSITRIIAFPLPNQNQEIDCVLEFYDKTLLEWLPHTFIKLPVNEPKEHILHAIPPESVFSTTWRFRTILNEEEKSPFIFNMTKFQPKADPSVEDCEPVIEPEEDEDIAITAEQLSGVLRVDSYFAPHLTPRNAICLRFRNIQLNVHNSLPSIDSGVASLEGYYVSKQLMRAHRVLTITAEESTVHTALNSSAGILLLLETLISSDILDCTTGIMERMIKNFRVQAGLSIPGSPLDMEASRVRCCTTNIHVALHVPRLRTLLSLADDWTKALGEQSQQDDMHSEKSKKDLAEEAVTMLEGRVSLWIHNSCASTLRIGQENTEEVILLGPGVRLAYRWNSPTEIRRIRFASGNQTADWHWSNSIPFVPGDYRVRLEHEDPSLIPTPNCGEFVSVVVKQIGAHREMRLSGRLLLANMLRLNLLYKVREHTKEDNQWHTASTGELSSETINRTIICHSNSDLVLKIRFLNHETGWSGDIPLKECPKENVPWLVKVPSNGDVPYISVWCRVVRARSDGRIFATIWPLYVLRSDLTLDTDVLLSTDMGTVSMESSSEVAQPAPIIQSAPGRGSSTHLLAPGTTSARHSLSFQYRNIECPVTRDAVPLHYGVTDTSVFDKRAPVNKVDEILKDITAWLERSGQNAVSSWPYSIVSKHWVGEWKPALLQPRCEVTVQYQAVRAGGGCSLEIKLSPLVIICNASPITLTLRAHDAAPMCKLEPGSVISPPPTVLKKPFFMSIEIGRETFVSNQLQVCCKEPGRYESPPTGQVAIDYPITFAIQCNQKVTLLNLYYEVKEEINVLGITSAYIFFNKLDTDLMVSAIVVPNEISHEIVLNPKTFKSIPPAKPGSVHGKPLCRFWLRDRWRGGDVSELQMFLCIALPHEDAIDISAVPIRLGLNTERKAISLMSSTGKSMPIVVTQHKHEGRWIVTVDKDPCPQFVVHNQTGATIAIAQPKTEQQEENFIETVPDCVGTQWWLTVAPDAVTHYSTPGYCIRHPVPPEVPVLVPFLTFAKVHNEEAPVWCPPVAVADGEQLVQLTFNVTVKLHVRTYPHSTLIELKDVDQHDISASEIRRRLIDQDLYNEAIPHTVLKHETSQKEIDRVGAHERLISTHTFSVRDTKEEQEITRQEFLKEIDEAVIEVKSSHHHLVEPESAPKLADITPSAHRELKVSESFDMKYERAQAIMKQKMRRNLANTDLEPKPSIHIILKYPSSAMTVGKNSITALEKFIGVSSGSDNNPQPIAGSSSKPEATTNAVFIGSAGSEVSTLLPAQDQQSDWEECSRAEPERLHCVIAGIVVEMAAAADTRPLVALHIDRAALQLFTFYKKTKTTISIADVQIDNLQYDNGQFDFAVIATTRAEPLAPDHWTTLWSMFTDNAVFATKHENARILLKTCHDSWTSASYSYNELTEVDVHAGPLALYVEDAYVTALAELFRLAAPAGKAGDDAAILAEFYSMRAPLRLRLLYIRPLDITLTLHTAVRMYIALDQSPLHLGAFRLQYMFTSTERLAHALTVHYLSAAILGAGWVVGGLELLGAPGALAARVGGATGGVRGIASAAAAALLRSLSAWAGSLARNLDLLAGDEEHARRAAAARRRPPDSFVAGLLAGITNFAINILGAVGGLAHHPLVGVAVGETGSSTAALRRGLLGALTKPLSATADLVAYAGHGLLKQTGWDPVPQPRSLIARGEVPPSGWTRECVRWLFRLPELTAIVGHEATLGDTPVMLLFTHKFLVIADPLTESIMESIDFRFCTLGPFDNSVIELSVRQANERRVSRAVELDREENDDLRVSAAAMARVARYTGAGGGAGGAAGERARLVALAPAPGHAPALYALLTAAIHHNSDTHFSLM